MVTFWNLKWWFLVNFHSSPGAAAWRSWAWSSWLVSSPMISSRIGKGHCCFYPLHAHHLDKGLSYIIVWPDTEDEKHMKGWVSVTNTTQSVLFWRTWEHLVWGHHSPITLLYHLEFIQLQVTENPILIERFYQVTCLDSKGMAWCTEFTSNAICLTILSSAYSLLTPFQSNGLETQRQIQNSNSPG